MKRTSIYQIVLLIGLLAFAVFILNKTECNGLIPVQDTVSVIDTTEFVDTIPYYDTIPVKPASKIVNKEVPSDIDSLEIAKKFFAHVFRDDTLKNDSNVFIRLKQEITQNDVIKQVLEVHDFENTLVINKKETVKMHVPAPKFYIGAFTTISNDNVVAGGKLMFRTQKDLYLSAGYGTKNTVYVDILIPLNKLFTKKQTK